MTQLEGEVYTYESARRVVAVRVGLTPKVIRFPTDQDWKHGEKVVVTVTPASEVEQDIITVEGSIE